MSLESNSGIEHEEESFDGQVLSEIEELGGHTERSTIYSQLVEDNSGWNFASLDTGNHRIKIEWKYNEGDEFPYGYGIAQDNYIGAKQRIPIKILLEVDKEVLKKLNQAMGSLEPVDFDLDAFMENNDSFLSDLQEKGYEVRLIPKILC